MANRLFLISSSLVLFYVASGLYLGGVFWILSYGLISGLLYPLLSNMKRSKSNNGEYVIAPATIGAVAWLPFAVLFVVWGSFAYANRGLGYAYNLIEKTGKAILMAYGERMVKRLNAKVDVAESDAASANKDS